MSGGTVAPKLCRKSSQVSPSARTRTQCKGGGGKEKYIHQKLYKLQASPRKHGRNMCMERKSGKDGERRKEPHFSQQFPNCQKHANLWWELALGSCILWRFSWEFYDGFSESFRLYPCHGVFEASRVEPACPKAALVGRREATKLNPI